MLIEVIMVSNIICLKIFICKIYKTFKGVDFYYEKAK